MRLKGLHVMSKVFATQDCWPAGQKNTTHYTDPYTTHIDQKLVVSESPIHINLSNGYWGSAITAYCHRKHHMQ